MNTEFYKGKRKHKKIQSKMKISTAETKKQKQNKKHWKK